MILGTTKFTQYIVEYTDPNQAEGGPIVTRFCDTLQEAIKTADRAKANPELSNVTITKQYTHIVRERIHWDAEQIS